MGLEMREDGYVQLSELLKLRDFRKHNVTFDLIKEIVDSNDKQRYSMTQEQNVWFIRANQGHSIKCVKSEYLLKEIGKYPTVCHGTYFKYLEAVMREGLKSMSRNHVHFGLSDCFKGAVSGMRSSCEILIYLNMSLAMKDGIKFFLSDNNVILSHGLNGVIAPKYFAKVVKFENGKPGKIIFTNDMKMNQSNHQNTK